MPSANFNLIDIIAVLKKHIRRIISFALIVMIATIITLFVVPKYYRSVTYIVPANPDLADKARLFNSNIQRLYSFFGNNDDLEMLSGISRLDTVFYQLVDEFNLVNYYHPAGTSVSNKRRNAMRDLKEDLLIQKTETNQLKITSWTKKAQLSARLANRAVEIIQLVEQDIWRNNYQHSLDNIDTSIGLMEKNALQLSGSLKKLDPASAEAALLLIKKQQLSDQLQQYQKSANELKLAIKNTPPSLYVIEKATPAAISEKPKKLEVLLAALFTSIFFGCIAVLIYERKQPVS